MKLSSFTPPLYKVGEHNTKIFFLNLDTVLSNSTPENFANVWQLKWNWIRSMKFETVRIHVFGLLSSRNFATMAKWRIDFSSPYRLNIRHNKRNFSKMANSRGNERFRYAVCFHCILLWNLEEDWERGEWSPGTRHMAKEFGIFWNVLTRCHFHVW